MRIVIVEDEPRIREGIVHIIEEHTAHTIAAAASSAEEGLEVILRECPDLVITDIRMGEMDGLTMLKKVREAKNDCAVVVLTGYSSFDYARQAIHLDVLDYLLKPITVEDLLTCLEKVESAGHKSTRTPPLEQMLVMQLTGSQMDAEQLARAFEQRYEVDINEQHMMVLFQLQTVDNESFFWALNKIKEKIQMLCLENTALLELYSRQAMLMLVMQSERNTRLEKTVEQYILKSVLEEVRCLCVSRRFCGIDQLKKELDGCLASLRYSLLIPEGTIITSESLREFPCRKLAYPADLEQRMKQVIGCKDCAGMHRIADEFEALVFSLEYSPESITEVLIRFLCTVCVTAEEKNPELKGFFSYNTLLNEIGALTSMEELRAYWRDLVEQIAQKRPDSTSKINNLIVSRVVSFVQQHYMEDLSLSVLSDALNLTPEYLSSLFSKEMGINFSSFLKHFRVSHARRLLDENNLKINEVASLVGFHDPKYFNRVFKEVSGISPSEYRSSLRS